MRRIVGEAPVYSPLRLTIPVREALEHAGNQVEPDAGEPTLYRVTLTGRVPAELHVVRIPDAIIGRGAGHHLGLRMDDEPEYPGEDADAVAWHERGAWVPCPHQGCRRALVWAEAGYVPGYRICTAGHHAQLSGDGRTAKPVVL